VTADVLPFATPRSRVQEQQESGPKDEHVGEVHFYRRPDGQYYFLNRAFGGSEPEVFEQERELYRAMQRGVVLQGLHLGKLAGDKWIEGDNALIFAVFVHHSGSVRTFLSPTGRFLEPSSQAWALERFDEARRSLLEMSEERQESGD
jgi:hypothetical protein